MQADTTVPWQKSTAIIQTQQTQIEMGWALKTSKKSVRFTNKQINYLQSKFQYGEETGNKVDPADVSKDMRMVKDSNGQKLFTPDEYLTTRQISSFISREAARRRMKSMTAAAAEAEHDEDITHLAEEMNIEMLHEIVANSLLFKHPLFFDDMNLSGCEIVKRKQLTNIKLQKLKEICEHLGIDTSGLKQNRKAPFVDKIEQFVLECTCFK